MNQPPRIFLVSAILAALLAAGCSPHPGSGNWVATGGDPEFDRLEVHFKGWADLYRPNAEEAAHHCFWSTYGERVIELSCTPADDPDAEVHFRLNVAEGGTASLTRNEQLVGRYRRQAQP